MGASTEIHCNMAIESVDDRLTGCVQPCEGFILVRVEGTWRKVFEIFYFGLLQKILESNGCPCSPHS